MKARNPLRMFALFALSTGAVLSLILMFKAGHPPILLLILFTGWVSSPFLALLIASLFSGRWPVFGHTSLDWLMITITLFSLLGYSGAVTPPGVRPAFIFLMVPMGSWLIILSFVGIAVWRSRRKEGIKPD